MVYKCQVPPAVAKQFLWTIDMPYSITTKDGITIDNIPDNVPSDAGTLKERVAQIRAQRGGESQSAPSAAPSAATAPAKVDAPTNGYVMGLRDPVDALAQIARRIVPEGVASKVDELGNYLSDLGLPVAKSAGVAGVDKIVSDVNKQYGQQRKASAGDQEPGFDLARLAGNVVNPVNALPGVALTKGANTLASLATRGAVAGGVGGALQPVTENAGENFASQKAGQVLGGALAGAAATPAITRVGERVASGIGNAVSRLRPAASGAAPSVDVAMNNVFASQGLNPAEVSDLIKNSVRAQIEESLSAKGKIDPAAVIRKAQFEAVGLKGNAGPTSGQLSRDPMQFANEKNLSGLNINGENGLASRFQAQNQVLQDVFDAAGATGATDRLTAGQTIMNGLRQADAPVKQGVDDLYARARGMTEGRVADLDRAQFSQAANEALDQGMYNSFLPGNVRSLLNDISNGKGPFNVESAVQIDSLLSRAQRQAERSGDSAGASAIGIIRTKLHDTPFAQQAAAQTPEAAVAAENAAAQQASRTVDNGIDDVVFRDVPNPQIGGAQRIEGARSAVPATQAEPNYSQIGTGLGPVVPQQQDAGQAAREAFEQARGAARARFATIEQTPALKAALDENAPDKFVQQYILNANAGDVAALKKVLQGSPDAQAQARSQVADYLKRAAFGENPSGDKAFAADRYLKTLTALGPQKLALFFSPDEVVRLNLAGKVASDINSIPVGAKYGTNTSGTAAAIGNAVLGVLDKVPGGSVLGVPLNFAKREFGNYQTQKAISSALNPSTQVATESAAPIAPELVRAFQALGIGGGGLGGGAVAGSNLRN